MDNNLKYKNINVFKICYKNIICVLGNHDYYLLGKENKLQLKKMQEELEHWKKMYQQENKQTRTQEVINVRKIVNINTTSTKEEQLKDLITSIQQVKDSLVNILDEYEEAGEVDKADTLTEALDALEDAYDVVNDVLLDD